MNESPPLAYVIHHHVQHCQHCGRSHDYCAIYSRSDVKPVTITGLGRAVSNLHTIRQPSDVSWNVPVEYAQARIVDIPFCHACYASVDLSHHLTPPKPQVIVNIPRDIPAAKPKPEPRERIRPATIDDMLA